ncbi:MAG: hypothetical protein IPJ30_14420 [Acidobacteria bacterium]|nr:hypothetical protein [Acidobacteriota bacterium]
MLRLFFPGNALISSPGLFTDDVGRASSGIESAFLSRDTIDNRRSSSNCGFFSLQLVDHFSRFGLARIWKGEYVAVLHFVVWFLVEFILGAAVLCKLAAGRTDYFAKLYWIELPLYAALAWFLIGRFEIVGAATAFALRAVFDGIWAMILCDRLTHLRYNLQAYVFPLLFGVAVLSPMVIFATFDSFSPFLFAAALPSFGFYGLIAWKKLLGATRESLVDSQLRRIYA